MTYRSWLSLVCGLAIGWVVVGSSSPARACGGCFHEPAAPTVVTGHRMAVAINGQRTVLWDQFSYSGDAEDFVWALPVDGTTTEVAVAPALFFDELEAATSPVVVGPPLPFSSADEEGWGCGGDDDAGSAVPSAGQPTVTVHSMTTVGPYETVTVSSESPTALVDWLQEHGYSVPDELLPVIGGYVETGMAFVVVRLRPGVGVQAMAPIRVAYPGTSVALPLRMIAAGVADDVALLLWVFGEGRYEAASFANAQVDGSELWRDTSVFPPRNNYTQVFDDTLAALGGRGWITESALSASTAGAAAETEPRSGLTIPATGRSSAEWRFAMEGLSEAAVLTRMRTRLTRDALTTDLVLGLAAGAPERISRIYYTDRTSRTASFPAGPALVVAAVAAALLLGRRRRPSPKRG